MKPKYLLQLSVLLAMLVSSLGPNLTVSAAPSSGIIVNRTLVFWHTSHLHPHIYPDLYPYYYTQWPNCHDHSNSTNINVAAFHPHTNTNTSAGHTQCHTVDGDLNINTHIDFRGDSNLLPSQRDHRL